MVKKTVIICIFIFIIQTAFGLSIFLSNFKLNQSDPNITLTNDDKIAGKIFYKNVLKSDFEGLLTIKFLQNQKAYFDKTVNSSLEASEICELLQIDYLTYGIVEKTNKFYYAELKIFENETKTIKKTFYVKIEFGNLEELMNELSNKFINYMHDMLGLSEYVLERKRGFGGFGVYVGAGYWTPLSDWNQIIFGLFTADIGFNVIPMNYLVKTRKFRLYLSTGLIISYSMAINKPDLITSYFHSILFKIPCTLNMEANFNHNFFIGIGPHLQLDLLYQESTFNDPGITSTIGFGFFANTGYEYWFGKRKIISLGFNNIFDFTFYDNIFIDYKIQIFTTVRIPVGEKNNKSKQVKNNSNNNPKEIINKNKKNEKELLQDNSVINEEGEKSVNNEKETDDEETIDTFIIEE